MKRVLLLVLVALLAAVLGVAAWLLGTTAGARWLAERVQAAEPRLELEIADGNLWEGLDLRQLSWQQPDLRLSVPQASLRWRLGCLSTGRLCLDRVELHEPALEVDPTADSGTDTAEEPASAATELRLPVAVQLRQLVLTRPRVRVGETRIAARRLAAKAALAGRQLRVDALDAERLRLELPAQQAAAGPAAAAAAPLALPAIDLPLDVALRQVALDRLELRQGDQHWQLRDIELAAGLHEGRLRLRRLAVQAPQGRLAAEGQATLRGDYPLDLEVNLELRLPEVEPPLRLHAQLGQSLADLRLALRAEGAVQARLQGSLRPLAPDLPFDLRLRAKQLQWPSGAPELQLNDLELSLSGDRGSYRYEGSTAVRAAALEEEPARVALRGQGDLQGLQVEQLRLQALGGQVEGQARLSWAPELQWSARLRAQDLNTGRLAPQWPGRLGGPLTVVGGADAEGWRLSVRSAGFGGELRGYPAQLAGTVHRTTAGVWQADELRLRSGDNRLRVDGRAGQRWDLVARLDFDALQALLPQAEGGLSGDLRVQGPLRRPDVALDLASGGLRVGGSRLESASVRGRIAALGEQPSELEWQLRGLQVEEQTLGRVQGSLDGTLQAHELALALSGGPYGGELRLRGGMSDWQAWRGSLEQARVELPHQAWTLAQPADLAWTRGDALVLRPHCWQQREARLCLEQAARLGPSGALALRLSGYRIERLQPWLPQGLRWSGPLQASAALGWAPQQPPRLELTARSDGGSLRLRPVAEEPPLDLAYQGLVLEGRVVEQQLNAQLRLDSRAMGDAEVRVQVGLAEAARPLSGELRLQGLRLEPVEPLFPQIRRLQGRLSAEGKLGGTLRDPRFTGRIALAEGQVVAPTLPMTPSEIALELRVDGQQAKLTGGFVSGEGRARLSGELSWGGEAWELEAALQGQSLRVAQRPLYELQVSPDLQLRARPGQVSLTGVLRVPQGQIRLASLPSQAVAVSEDVVIVNRTPAERRAAPKPEPGALAGWDIDTRIEVILGEDVELTGYGLSGRLEGRLRLRQLTRAAPEASGEIRIVNGRYEAYGQKLKIRQGQLLFAGPLTDPRLSVEAVREVGEVIAGVRITGPADSPEVSLFSEPPMPQDEILSYLVRGKPPGAPGGDSSGLLAQAALALGVYGGKGYASRFAEELGVENFALGTAGEGEEAQVVFSGYLSPNLFLSYGVGVFQPQNTLTLRYQLSDRLYLEAVSGLESALDLFYQFEFGGEGE